jgi:hypothetical protein
MKSSAAADTRISLAIVDEQGSRNTDVAAYFQETGVSHETTSSMMMTQQEECL